MGFNVKKAFRKAVGGKVAGAVSKVVNTKNLSYVAPYTLALTSGGRQQLMKTYGPFVGAAGSLVGGGGGGAAAGVFADVTNGILESPREPAAESAQVYSEGASSGAPQAGAFARESGGDRTPLYIIAGIVVVGLVLLPRLIRK